MKLFYYILGLILLFFIVFTGGLFTTRVINKDFSVDTVKLIFDMPSISDSVSQHQKDARYLPYKLRLVVFNQSIYLYQALRNIAKFLSLSNFNKIFLLANLYPILLGLRSLYKDKYLWWICIVWLSATLSVVGINKMVDARSATWFSMPIFGYLIIRGIKKINFKVYIPMLFISVLLL